MDERVEQILLSLVRQHAPNILQNWDQRGGYEQRVPRLARALADANILVLMADQPPSLAVIARDAQTLVQEWVNGYWKFYTRICREIFPSYIQLSAHTTDNQWPLVLYLRGEATPVIQRMAGYISPYIVERQFSPVVSEAELIGLMDIVLDELEAWNIPREAYKRLRGDGAAILQEMLGTAIQQLPLTEFDRTIFTDSRRFIPVKSAPPATLPEATHHPVPQQADTTQLNPTEQILPTANGEAAPRPPLVRRDNREGERKRRPPVPPIPGEKLT